MARRTFGESGMVKPIFLPAIRTVTIRTLAAIMIGPVMTIDTLCMAGMVKENLMPGIRTVTPRTFSAIMSRRSFINMAINAGININMIKRCCQPIAGDMASTTREIGIVIGGTDMTLCTIGQSNMIKLGLIPSRHRVAIFTIPLIMINWFINQMTGLAIGQATMVNIYIRPTIRADVTFCTRLSQPWLSGVSNVVRNRSIELVALPAFTGIIMLIWCVFPISYIGMTRDTSTRIMIFRLFIAVARLAFHHTGMGKLVRYPIFAGVALITISGEVVGI
jgi:hypothetical protein